MKYMPGVIIKEAVQYLALHPRIQITRSKTTKQEQGQGQGQGQGPAVGVQIVDSVF